MPKQRAPIDYDRYRELQSQGLSRRQIAKALEIPESTLRDNLKVIQKGQERGKPMVDKSIHAPQEQSAGLPEAGTFPPYHEGVRDVRMSTPTAHEILDQFPDFQEMLAWWQMRRAYVHDGDGPERKLERQTYHIEKRFIDAIKREADLERTTIAEVVNRAFHQYFAGRET